MSNTTHAQQSKQATTSHRTSSGHAAPGCRVVHVAVPENVFNHAKAQAYLSGVKWPKFVELLLSNSTPLEQPQHSS